MLRVNMHEAKTNLSKLVEKAEAGETVEIMRAGKVVALLTPKSKPKRVLGALAHLGPLPADWDSKETNEAIARLFHADTDPVGYQRPAFRTTRTKKAE